MQRRQFISLFGGIATGLMWPFSSSAQKPNIRRIGVLVVGNADADAVTFQTELREELRKSGYVEGQNLTFELRSAEQKIDLLPKLAAELVAQKVDVIVALYTPCALAAKQATREIPIVAVSGDPVGTGLVPSTSKNVADLAVRHSLPAATVPRSFAEAGGMLSYGADSSTSFRQSAKFVTKILQGGLPADMPIEQPTKFELVINLKTAKALGLTVAETFLQRADVIIE
jgi:ABC-type uncharacterized transport system substrate-binding protein